MDSPQLKTPGATVARAWRGVWSATTGYLFPVLSWLPANARSLDTASDMSSGLVIVLPGIEGHSSLTSGVVQGLHDSGILPAVVVNDWTTGFWPLFLYHLHARQRNRQKAAEIADVIVEYQNNWPGCPVHLIGHSGGAAMAVWILESLPATCRVDTAILLAPALSPKYNLAAALRQTRRGIWNFHTPFDLLYLVAGTLLFGTIDRRHCIAAGTRGFVEPKNLAAEDQSLYRAKLHQKRYTISMLNQFHPGGHFGWANRVFVAETVAPILCNDAAQPA